MEKRINWVDTPRRWRPTKLQQTNNDLLKNLNQWETLNRKEFDVRSIANIQSWESRLILKSLKKDKNWDNYIVIQWRKYYEHNSGTPEHDLFFSLKWWSIFIWEKVEWMEIRNWAMYRCILELTWKKTITTYRADYLKNGDVRFRNVLKTEVVPWEDVVATVSKWMKMVPITQKMIDDYRKWTASKTTIEIIEKAKRVDPWFAGFMDDM